LYRLWRWKGGYLTFQNIHKLEENDGNVEEYDYFGDNAQIYEFYATLGGCRDILPQFCVIGS